MAPSVIVFHVRLADSAKADGFLVRAISCSELRMRVNERCKADMRIYTLQGDSFDRLEFSECRPSEMCMIYALAADKNIQDYYELAVNVDLMHGLRLNPRLGFNAPSCEHHHHQHCCTE